MFQVVVIANENGDIEYESLKFRTEIEALKYRMLLLGKGIKATHRCLI